jgi:hypothetical protein
MIVGAAVLIIAAFGVALYLSRARRHAPQTLETMGSATPPAVVDDGQLVESGGGSRESGAGGSPHP